MRINRWVVVAVTFALTAGACGSRTSDKSKTPTVSQETTAASGSASTGGSSGPSDPDTPCGPGTAKGATDKGVTDTTIQVSTIQDIGGARPGLFQGNLDAMNAFVAYCNSLGGVLGRKLELQRLDSALFQHHDAVQQACDKGFAIVGQAAAFDDGGAQLAVDCGIPEVPAFTATSSAAAAVNQVQPIPNPPNYLSVGPQRYTAKKDPQAVKHAAMLYVDQGTTRVTAQKRVEGYQQVGFHFDVNKSIGITQLEWGPYVDEFRSNNVQWFNVLSDYANLAGIEKALQQQNVTVKYPETDQSGYDPGFLKAAGTAANGTLVVATTVPFEEKSTSRELRLFLEWLDKTNAKAPPSALGVQGWSAGLLFATAAKSLGSNVTRKGLLTALKATHKWDGHGIHVEADPGSNRPTECWMYLKVKNGKFVRDYPAKGFSCDPKNVVKLKGSYGKGAGT